MSYFYNYNESVCDYPEGSYISTNPEVAIYTASPQGKEEQYIIMDQIECNDDDFEEVSDVDEYGCSISKKITQSEFVSKFESVINLAIIKVNDAADSKCYLYKSGYTDDYDTLVMYYPGKSIGISINAYFNLTYYEPDATTRFDTDTEYECGLGRSEDEREPDEFLEISKDEFIEGFMNKIKITKKFINRT